MLTACILAIALTIAPMHAALTHLCDTTEMDSVLTILTETANGKYKGKQTAAEAQRSNEAMSALGYIYTQHYADYQRGYTYIMDALEACDTATTYLNLGRYYIAVKEEDKALSAFRTAFRKAVDAKEWTWIPTIFANMHYVAFRYGWLDKILEETDEYRKLQFGMNATMIRYNRHLIKGHDAYLIGDYKTAYHAFNLMKAAADSPYAIGRYAAIARFYQAVCADSLGIEGPLLDVDEWQGYGTFNHESAPLIYELEKTTRETRKAAAIRPYIRWITGLAIATCILLITTIVLCFKRREGR